MPPKADRALLLYDGLCGLCNRLNRFVLTHDRREIFDFASLQSDVARAKLAAFGVDSAALTTMYVIVGYDSASPALLQRGRAALFVAKMLGAPWSWLGIARVFPDALLNWSYDVLSRNRHRLFGRTNVCEVPAPDVRARFLDI